jgi:lipoprotein signal peptidase
MTTTPPPYVPHQPEKTSAPITHGSSNGFSITSLILGILSLLGFGFLAGIPAIIFGAIALKRKQPERGMSLAGVITGSIGTLFSLLLVAFIVAVITIGHNSDYYYNEPLPPYDGYSAPAENPRT